MKAFSAGLLGLVLVVGIGIYMASRPSPSPKGVGTHQVPATLDAPAAPAPADEPPISPAPAIKPPSTSKAPEVQRPESVQPKPPYAKITIKAGQPIPRLFPYQTERDQLYALAASQDSKQIPTIATSLKHADAGVREAARQALLQMGNPDAVPSLKAAAAAAKDPDEAQLMREAAEFLSLPRITDGMTESEVSPTTNTLTTAISTP